MNACGLSSFNVSILQSLEAVSSPIKMQVLSGSLERLANLEVVLPTEATILQNQFATLLVSSIDGASLKDLNDSENASWAVYKTLVYRYFRSGMVGLHLPAMYALTLDIFRLSGFPQIGHFQSSSEFYIFWPEI